jgi:hypothetical protein
MAAWKRWLNGVKGKSARDSVSRTPDPSLSKEAHPVWKTNARGVV